MSPLPFVLIYTLGLAGMAYMFFCQPVSRHLKLALIALVALLLALLLAQSMTDLTGVALMALAMLLVLVLTRLRSDAWQWRLKWVVVIYVLLLYFLGKFAYYPLTLLDQMNPQGQSFEVRLNAQKALLALVLAGGIVSYHRRAFSLSKLAVILGGLVALALLSLALGLSWYPKWQHGILLLITVNLLVTVVSEELYFRLYLQEALRPLVKNEVLLLSLMAILFSALHFSWVLGWQGFMLVALAGYLYAWVYRHVSVLASILTHAGLNALHMVFFAYPMVV